MYGEEKNRARFLLLLLLLLVVVVVVVVLQSRALINKMRSREREIPFFFNSFVVRKKETHVGGGLFSKVHSCNVFLKRTPAGWNIYVRCVQTNNNVNARAEHIHMSFKLSESCMKVVCAGIYFDLKN